MRRFWLFLLVLMVLPVQMSWAAIHYCDDGAPVSAAVLAVASEAAGYIAAIPSDDRRQADAPVKKAPSAHSCHGLHELMAHAVEALIEPAKEMALASSEPVFRPSAVASRRDRPQWPAA